MNAARPAAPRVLDRVHRGGPLRRRWANPRAQVVHQPQAGRGDPVRGRGSVVVRHRLFSIIQIVRETGLLASCPPCTEADLYVFVGRHWSELSRRYGPLFTLEEAAEDFSIASRKKRLVNKARRWRALLAWILRRGRRTGNQPPRV